MCCQFLIKQIIVTKTSTEAKNKHRKYSLKSISPFRALSNLSPPLIVYTDNSIILHTFHKILNLFPHRANSRIHSFVTEFMFTNSALFWGTCAKVPSSMLNFLRLWFSQFTYLCTLLGLRLSPSL